MPGDKPPSAAESCAASSSPKISRCRILFYERCRANSPLHCYWRARSVLLSRLSDEMRNVTRRAASALADLSRRLACFPRVACSRAP